MGVRLLNHLRRHVVGYLALCLALSGTAYALGRNSVDSRELAPDSVRASELAKNAVASSNIKNGAVGAADLDDGYCGYTGQVVLVAFNYAPVGTLPADGSTYPITGSDQQGDPYETLFELYGTTYGGDGTTTFGVPKLTGPVANTQYVICLAGNFPIHP